MAGEAGLGENWLGEAWYGWRDRQGKAWLD